MAIDISRFTAILRMTEDELYEYLKIRLVKKYGADKVIFGGDWLYAEGDLPIMVEAHLDTVHAHPPAQIFYDDKQKVMWSPQGIGGDDRCGVMAIMEVMKTHKPHVLFCKQEERGAVGARAAAPVLRPDVNFIIGLDRRGSQDAVFYDCANKKFQDYVCKFGFKLETGSFSDIGVLAPKWDVAAVNFSVGYFSEHSANEHIFLDALEATIGKVCNIIAAGAPVKYKFEKKVWGGTTYVAPTVQRTHYSSESYTKPANTSTLPKETDVREHLQLQLFY